MQRMTLQWLRCFHPSIGGGGRWDRVPAFTHSGPVARCITPSSRRGAAATTRTHTKTGPVSAKTNHRPRLFSGRATNDGRLTSRMNQELSRKEQRTIERRKRYPREKWHETDVSAPRDGTPESSNGAGAASKKFNRLATVGRTRLASFFRSLTPRVPGRQQRPFCRTEWTALARRLPAFLAIAYLVTDEDTSPYVVRASLGPSMLPTIQFVGDIWLVETGAWRRAWRRLLQNRRITTTTSSSSDPDSPSLLSSVPSSEYQVGDLVLWREPKSGRVSCKRIVGLQGDAVHRYGQYAQLYRSRRDLGIVWPSDAESRNLDPNRRWDANATKATSSVASSETDYTGERHDVFLQTLIVPRDCVWLEGDNCLFSVDSRQYGPIPTSWVCGRLIFRLWPWNREELIGDNNYSYLSSCWISRRRPVPYPAVEPYLGKRFNFYKA